MDTVQAAWRRHKSTLKKNHFEAYADDEIRLQKRHEYTPASQFKDLLKYWGSENVQVSLLLAATKAYYLQIMACLHLDKKNRTMNWTVRLLVQLN